MAVTSIVSDVANLQITDSNNVFSLSKANIQSITPINDYVYIKSISNEGDVIAIWSDVVEPVTANAEELADTIAGYLPSTDSDAGTGWAQYADTEYTESNKLVVTAGSTVNLPNDALSVIDSYLPTGGSSLYDSTLQKFTPVNIGDAYTIRVDFKSSTNNNNGYAELLLDIGGSFGVILQRSINFPRGTAVTRSFSSTNLVYTLGTFIANGGQFQVEGITGTTSIWDIVYVIERSHNAG